MKVKVAAQTFSSSVADALQYFMDAGHPSFSDAKGTIKFIRYVDKKFDILNSRNPKGKGYKQPIRLTNEEYISKSVQEINKYLVNLRTVSGQRLTIHRMKTFVIGFIMSGKSLLQLSHRLLRRLRCLQYRPLGLPLEPPGAWRALS